MERVRGEHRGRFEPNVRNHLATPPMWDGTCWPCGHPRTEANSQSVGVAGVRCRECRRRLQRKSSEPTTTTRGTEVVG